MRYTIGMSGYYTDRIRRWLPRFATLSLYIFLLANVAYSQYVPDVYYSLMSGNRSSAAYFLQSLRNTRWYARFSPMLTAIYGHSFDDDIFFDKIYRSDQIKSLEAIVSRYPPHRDVFYYLSLLYREQGDVNSADRYLQMAKEIDPLVEQYVKYEKKPLVR